MEDGNYTPHMPHPLQMHTPRYEGGPTYENFAKKFAAQLNPWSEADLLGQGPTPITLKWKMNGESAANPHPLPVVTGFTTPTVDAVGGPQSKGGSLLLGTTGKGTLAAFGQIAKQGFQPVAAPVIPHLEHGTVSASVTAGNWVSQAVTFGTPFATTPSLVATVVTTVLQVTINGASTQAITISRSTTGAVIGLYNPTGATLTITADWIAFGA